MLTPLDSRLHTALRNDSAAQSLLNDLHRQILNRPHPHILAELLAKYVAAAAGRGGVSAATQPPSAQERESTMVTMLSNLARMRHEMLKTVANNLRG